MKTNNLNNNKNKQKVFLLLVLLIVIFIPSKLVQSCDADGTLCSIDADCCSNYCRSDYAGSVKYCAQDATSCVHNTAQFTEESFAPNCESYGTSGTPGSRFQCLDGSWTGGNSCGFLALSCVDECNSEQQANSCSDGTNAICNTGGAGAVSTSIVDGQYCSAGSIYTCDSTHPASCVQGVYILEPDVNSTICECSIIGTQGICNTTSEQGCWDTTTSKCCGDDRILDSWISTTGSCSEGVWYDEIPISPNNPTNLNQSSGIEGSTTYNSKPTFKFTISSNDLSNVVLGYTIQIDSHSNFLAPSINYTWSGSTTNPNEISYTIPSGSELLDNPYYWRAKTFDNRGLESEWVEFQNPGVIDFTVNTFNKDDLNNYNFSGSWGVNLCGQNFTCGTYDGVCVNDLFDANPLASCLNNFGSGSIDFYKCADPDCSSACFNGTVNQFDSGTGIENAEVSYEINVWNGTGIEILTGNTYSNEFGYYKLNLPPGNGIYVFADAQGYAPALEGPFFNMIDNNCTKLDFTLVNGTCQDDCTKLGSNYCSASCHNEGSPTGICLFDVNTTFMNSQGQSIAIKSPYQACSELGVKVNNVANLGEYNRTIDGVIVPMCIKTECCEGTPFETPCPVSSITSSNLKDAIKVTRIAKYKGESVKIRTYYWK